MSEPSQRSPSDEKTGGTRRRIVELAAPLLLLVLVLGMFHDVLFSDGSRILSAQQQDLTSQFVPWREWGFGQLRSGHLSLWNPHTFCGMPFVGMLQSALFYPANFLYLILSIGSATNWTLALHVYLAALFMYCWARRREVGPVGSLVSGVAYILSAPYIMHLLPGHVPFLSVAAWTPLVLLVADALVDTPTIGWTLVGIAAVAMQVLAGYPQPAYIAGLAGSIYLVLNLIAPVARQVFLKYRDGDDGPSAELWKKSGRALVAWGVIYIAAAMLSAAQLGAAISTTNESGRGGDKAPFEFASSFPIPWSNAVTMIVPNFWGDKVHSPYYGEWFVWEVIPYYGAVALGLALYAGMTWDKRRRFAWTMAIIMMLLALGRQTPLYRLMYDYMPVFGKFRGSSRFAYGVAPFIALLAGIGCDQLRRAPKRSVLVLAVPALIGAGAAIYWSHQFLETAPLGVDGDWGKVLMWVESSSDPAILEPAQAQVNQIRQQQQTLKNQGKLDQATNDQLENRIQEIADEANEKFIGYRQGGKAIGAGRSEIVLFSAKNAAGKSEPGNMGKYDRVLADIAAQNSAEFVAGQLKFAAIILGCFGGLLILTLVDKRAAGLIAVLVVVEMVAYEMGIHITTPTHPEVPKELMAKVAEAKGDRVLAIGQDYFNCGMTYGMDNIWGYDPVVLRRTLEFLAYGQGVIDSKQLDKLVDQTPFSRLPYAVVMLRCRYVLLQTDTGLVVNPVNALPMKRLALVGSAVTRKGRDGILREVYSDAFNPRNTVVLEETPVPAPEGDRGVAEVMKEDTDSVEISADTPQPTILLVTDAYSAGWRARELNGDEQHQYKLLPADWMLRAIPLSKGHHHFVMEYSPQEWRIGKVISLLTLPAYLLLSGWTLVRKKRSTDKR